jgi:membrane protein DedA with SNARE-associated domain
MSSVIVREISVMTMVESLVTEYGMIAIFLLILAEYACFPVSSEVILPLAGLVGAGQGMAFPTLVLSASICGLAGSCITYGIGRLGGSPLLERLMVRFPSFSKPIQSSYRTFGDHGKSAVFLSRLIPLCRTYIGFVAGAMKQSLCGYLIYSSFGILLWNSVLISLGYYFYRCRNEFFSFFVPYKKWIFVLSSLLLLFFLFRRVRARKKKSEADQD